MGWLFMERPKGYSEAEWWKIRFGEPYWSRIKAHATKNNVFYAVLEVDAAEEPRCIPDENGKVRVAIVCLTKWVPKAQDGFNWGYKDMDEFMGPNEVDCPLRLLNMLSPLHGSVETYARQWRDDCRFRAENMRSIHKNGIYKIASPVAFIDGVKEDTFRCVERTGRRIKFIRQSDFYPVRLPARFHPALVHTGDHHV